MQLFVRSSTAHWVCNKSMRISLQMTEWNTYLQNKILLEPTKIEREIIVNDFIYKPSVIDTGIGEGGKGLWDNGV